MSNVTIDAPTVDGSLMDYIVEGDSCKEAVDLVVGDDQRPPARHLRIGVVTATGKRVMVVIPNSISDRAIVMVDGETI